MSTSALVPVEEYLNIHRNPILALSRRYPHIYAVPGLRSQTMETRYRLSDVCVLLAPPRTDPRLQRISVYTGGNVELVKGDSISTSDGIELTRDEIFQQ